MMTSIKGQGRWINVIEGSFFTLDGIIYLQRIYRELQYAGFEHLITTTPHAKRSISVVSVTVSVAVVMIIMRMVMITETIVVIGSVTFRKSDQQ